MQAMVKCSCPKQNGHFLNFHFKDYFMNKTLALVALLGLVSAPAFANEAAAPAKADKVVAATTEACKEGDKECAAKAAEAAKTAAPAAGEAKKEEAPKAAH